jgi:branched-chain amino acid transport system ATP-binding protein
LEDLKVVNLSKSFGGLQAVKDLSFSAKSGVITGLIGPNGAGKTTVFNLIGGYLRADRGDIFLGSKKITHLPPHQISRLGISRTFQLVRVIKGMTVLENVIVGRDSLSKINFLSWSLGFGKAWRKELEARQDAVAILEMLHLKEYEEKLAGILPLGIQRKLELARALARGPKFMLLDEPISGLNQKEAEEIGTFIQSTRSSGVGILLVEHNMDFMMDIADFIVVLNYGRKLAEGKPGEIQKDMSVIEAYLGGLKRNS